jgi:hypothetical protein
MYRALQASSRASYESCHPGTNGKSSCQARASLLPAMMLGRSCHFQEPIQNVGWQMVSWCALSIQKPVSWNPTVSFMPLRTSFPAKQTQIRFELLNMMVSGKSSLPSRIPNWEQILPKHQKEISLVIVLRISITLAEVKDA